MITVWMYFKCVQVVVPCASQMNISQDSVNSESLISDLWKRYGIKTI